MKAFYYLAAIAFLLACVSGILFWQTMLPPYPDDSLVSSVGKIRHSFEAQSKPVAVLNLDALLQQQSLASSELVDPKLTLPQTSHYLYSDLQPIQHYAENCGKDHHITLHSPALKKALLWAQFRCGVITTLPPSFFTSKPFMHPSGKSYAMLSLQSEQLELSRLREISQLKGSFHLSELLSLKEFQSPILNLSPWQLQLLINGENQIINEDYVFFPSPSSSINQNRLYSLYPIKSWMHFLSQQKFTVLYGARTGPCLFKEGNACWIENPDYKILTVRLICIPLLFAFLILGGILVTVLIQRARLQKLETAERLFTLQMLTHELRTPTASMRLSIEAFRKNYDELPQTSQKAFLQMCEELQRLNRVVDASKTYLSTDEMQSEIYLNAFVKEITESYEKPISFIPFSSDIKMTLNAYWLELCIRNFIENAFNHGNVPVNVILSRDSSHVSIQIQDQGQPVFESLHAMTAPFRKSETSRGLGLGLAIAEKMIKAMHGKLIFQQNPTRFTIQLRPI